MQEGRWGYRDHSRKIGFGRMRGLFRIHSYLGDVLTLLERRKYDEATMMVVQVLKSIYQCYQDNGDWRTAVLLVPVPDPSGRPDMGASPAELEICAGYRKNMFELDKATRAGLGPNNKEEEEEAGNANGTEETGETQGGGRGGGRGRRRR